MLQELRANTLGINGKISLSKEVKHIKNNKMGIVEPKTTITKIKYFPLGSIAEWRCKKKDPT